jgi:hypothetical protein
MVRIGIWKIDRRLRADDEARSEGQPIGVRFVPKVLTHDVALEKYDAVVYGRRKPFMSMGSPADA